MSSYVSNIKLGCKNLWEFYSFSYLDKQTKQNCVEKVFDDRILRKFYKELRDEVKSCLDIGAISILKNHHSG